MQEIFDKVSELVETGLGIDPQFVLIQLVATLILFLVVLKFVWKPLTALIETRQEIVKNELEEAKKANERAAQIQSELTVEYEQAKKEIKALIEQSIKEGKQEKESIIKDAKIEAQRRLANVEEEIETEIRAAQKEIKQSIVDVAFEAAEKIVKREIDKDAHEDIISDLIEGVGK